MAAQVVVITGASSGIGAALARKLGERGDKLVLGARRQDQLEQVARPFGQNALAVVTDVTRRADVDRLRDRALNTFGQVDVWVNNAGRGIGKQVLDVTDADFDAIMAVNLKSAFYGMQAIVPYFQQRGQGRLINVSSFLGRVPLATHRSIYNAAKAGLNALTANLRMDLAQDYPGIHISLVMPGLVDTDFPTRALGGTPALPPGAFPVKPQTADEVAGAIVQLIEHPAPELYTNPFNAEMVNRYYQDPAAFEVDYLASARPKPQ